MSSYGYGYGEQGRNSYSGSNARGGQQQQGYTHAGRNQYSHQPQYDYERQANQGQHPQYNMADGNHLQEPMKATFYPNQNDDFFMPEVISPTPTRIMPEVPSNMQEGLAHLELESRVPAMSASSSVSSVQSPYAEQRGSNRQSSRSTGPGFTASYEHTNASAYQNINRDNRNLLPSDSPKFSPFPKLRNPGQNVPLSDEDKEEVLERARPLVLKSIDPEMQLAWAQDALSWVEVASQCAARTQPEGQIGRPITPKIEHQLREDALNIVRFLADQHHPKAEFIKSMWLEFGKFGYRVDKKEAFIGYKNAAQKGYARAEYRIGMQYETGNNPAKAIEHYQKGVVARDSASNYRLGMMTLLGQHNMPQDYQRGVDLIRFAADTADENAPQGAYVYGMLLARELPNISIPEQFLAFDLNDAKMFIEKAAYLGFSKAQLKMAQAYELCQLGCEFEPALSLHYNALAARQGESEADMAISKWFLCGYEGIFDKNEELAFTYAKRAAMTKLATAEFAMGYFYEIGVYVSVDLRESEAWYKKASDHGNTDALGRIDSIRRNGALTKQDHEKVAISRIKSQYGSQRGGRPERFKTQPPPLPAMNEERMNEPQSRTSYGGPPLRAVNNAPPQRPVSTAPYPDDDMPHVAGYRPNPGLRANSVGGPVADRPSSAFGIRPHTHLATDNYGQGLRPGTEPMRPATSMGNMPQHPIQPSGRGGPPPPGGNRVPGYASQPHIIPQAEMGRPIQRRDPMQNQFQRPERLSSIQPPQGPPVMSGGMMSPQSLMSPQSMTSPQSMMSPQQQRPDSQNAGRPAQRPTPQQAMPSQQGPSRPSSASPSVAPSGSAQGSGTATPGAKKTGPATFEAMGIPVQKEERECIMM
ncbi:uncharacterized protein L3040_008738 [Drepanopeziza brunnea f. sp. 'multigermtubi']|uniref:Chitin synthase activator n=1 Tax=Marssonina brunnea f. sp. multigermtubi (strain MB_m1) TaxID=1072389 RepID=K1Y0V8_MARBU|nr:chitin synthase activator [Drepanopeziza brunnea f. sp. 'multigermtubi' MB_m1]EKD18759.1 chitin synthase activator [Drepanopeziza brunnea f. sp. 'multigermtubi' MB_m1]KAJ5033626.1 hypothetical protein L3040_008738 [Drepanopeziza brunnea f. sp. 'multigermtubi']